MVAKKQPQAQSKESKTPTVKVPTKTKETRGVEVTRKVRDRTYTFRVIDNTTK